MSTEDKSSEVWCPDSVLPRMGNDLELVGSLIGFFLEDVPPLLKDLEREIGMQSSETATRHAHSLKGLCANYDADSATATARSMEQFCRESRFDEAGALLPELIKRCNELGLALRAWRETHTEAGSCSSD